MFRVVVLRIAFPWATGLLKIKVGFIRLIFRFGDDFFHNQLIFDEHTKLTLLDPRKVARYYLLVIILKNKLNDGTVYKFNAIQCPLIQSLGEIARYSRASLQVPSSFPNVFIHRSCWTIKSMRMRNALLTPSL